MKATINGVFYETASPVYGIVFRDGKVLRSILPDNEIELYQQRLDTGEKILITSRGNPGNCHETQALVDELLA